ncbi:TlpA family protein disulfide reductase, partial [Elizabethkingia meningoseptica]|nr:TlpA family protein disulfide reductase [Elizabethkingia meningoseptica]
VSMDDNTAAFKKSAVALLTGLDGQKLYAKGGLKSDAAQKFALYGFKLPSFLILDKDGKVASRTFMNIMDPEFKTAMDKISGITGPAIVPPQMQMQPTPAPAPADSTKVKTEAKAK